MESFEIVGDLCLKCQEGGFADDAFVLMNPQPYHPMTRLVEIVTNLHPNAKGLDDLVAEHFDCEREMPSGDRHIGAVRITIERIEKD